MVGLDHLVVGGEELAVVRSFVLQLLCERLVVEADCDQLLPELDQIIFQGGVFP